MMEGVKTVYCKECGNKVQKKDLYCGNCGVKIQQKNKKLGSIKKMEPKTKKKISFVLLIIIILILMVVLLSSHYSPKTVAKQYVEALVHQNYNRLYQYLELGSDKTFTNKTIFTQLMKESNQVEIGKYHVTAVESNDNGTALVMISYYDKSDKTNKNMNVILTKQKRKKWIFFNQWKIASSETKKQVVEDFKVTVPKDSIVTYAGIKVHKKYLNSKESTKTVDTYILKQVFAFPTEIEIELPGGYKIEDHITPSAYRNRYSANISLSTILDKEQTEIKNTIKKDITTIYEYALKEKSYKEIKKKLKLESDQWENTYKTFVSNLNKAYNKLTAIEFTNITLTSARLNENGNLEFKFKANYHYTIQYMDFTHQEQTKDSSSYSYMTISYNMEDGHYNIVNASDLEDYFSRY